MWVKGLKCSLKATIKKELRDKILQELVRQNPVEVPPSMLSLQKKSLVESTGARLKKQGVKEDQIQKMIQESDKQINQQSLFQVQAGYLIQALAQKFNVKEDINQTRQLLEKSYGQKVDDSVVESFHWQRIQNQVLDKLIEKNTPQTN